VGIHASSAHDLQACALWARPRAPASQGSGWGWLGYSKDSGKLVLETTANQDPLSTKVRVSAPCVDAPAAGRSCACLVSWCSLLYGAGKRSVGRELRWPDRRLAGRA